MANGSWNCKLLKTCWILILSHLLFCNFAQTFLNRKSRWSVCTFFSLLKIVPLISQKISKQEGDWNFSLTHCLWICRLRCQYRKWCHSGLCLIIGDNTNKVLMFILPWIAFILLVCSVFTPYYSETVLYSDSELRNENEDGISILFYLQKIFPGIMHFFFFIGRYYAFYYKHSRTDTFLP